MRLSASTGWAESDAGWRLTRFDTFWRELEQLERCGFWRELEQLERCGLSALEAIHAAASATGREAEFGTLRPGLAADLVLVEGQPQPPG